MRMRSEKGHIVVNQRWHFELAVAALCRSLAPRSADSLVSFVAESSGESLEASSGAPSNTQRSRTISYYSYRYL